MPVYTINPGEMRTSITFQSPTISKDAGGAQKTVYANVASKPTVKARWINDHGQEALSSGAETSVQRATVTIRHRVDVETTWRVLKDAEPWQILSVDLIQGRNRWVELRVERVKATV